MEMQFEHLFDRVILQRGYSYYMDNLVEDLIFKGDEISAKVIGSEEYYVEISLENGEIDDMYCSCPYFDDGNKCAKYQEENEITAIGELLDTVDCKDLYLFLKEELEVNENLRFKFLARFQKLNNRKDCTEYLRFIDNVFDRHLGYDNFIHYNEVLDFSLDVDEIIEAIEELIENDEYGIALELIKHLIIFNPFMIYCIRLDKNISLKILMFILAQDSINFYVFRNG